MGLSRYTAKMFTDEARIDTDLSVNSAIYAGGRFDLIDSSVESVYHLLPSLMLGSYKRATIFQTRDTGKKMISGTAAYTIADKTLVVPSMNISFVASDVEKRLIMSNDVSIYEVYIDSYVSATTVKVRGNLLPGTDATMDDVRIPNSLVEDNKVLLGSLNLNRLVAPVHIVVESSMTQYVEALTMEDFAIFASDSNDNKEKIVFAFEGSSLLLKKGDNVTEYGALTLHAIMMPTPVTMDSDTIDLPDGAPIQLAIITMRNRILRRMGLPPSDPNAMQGILQNIYQMAGAEVKLEELSSKIKALMS